MSSETPKISYYAIIPAFIRYDKDLTPNSKLLYGEITALCNESGYCWARNEYFAGIYGVSITSISNWINSLVKKGYIIREIVYKEGTKEVERRALRIADCGVQENLGRCSNNFGEGGQKNLKDNNTSIIKKEIKKESENKSTTYSAEELDYWFNTTYEIYPRKHSPLKAKDFYERKLRGLSREEAKNKANMIYGLLKRQILIWERENDYEGRQKEHIPYFSSWLKDNVEDSPHFKRRK